MKCVNGEADVQKWWIFRFLDFQEIVEKLYNTPPTKRSRELK